MKIWYHLIRTHLMPTTHIEIVNRDRLILLHCILEGKSINIGNIIQGEISACVSKLRGYLFFSSLITDLCLRVGVDVTSNDVILANMGPISIGAIKRFLTPAYKPVPSPATGPSQPQGGLELKVEQLT